MLKTITRSRARVVPARQPRAACPDQSSEDLSTLTIAAMRSMSVEVLRLHLSSRNLVTTGNRIAMAQHLHSAVSSEQVGDAPLPPAPPGTESAQSLPQLERTVQSLVDKSLEGLTAGVTPHYAARCFSPTPSRGRQQHLHAFR